MWDWTRILKDQVDADRREVGDMAWAKTEQPDPVLGAPGSGR